MEGSRGQGAEQGHFRRVLSRVRSSDVEYGRPNRMPGLMPAGNEDPPAEAPEPECSAVDDDSDEETVTIAGISGSVLEMVEAEDLEGLIRLRVAMGKCHLSLVQASLAVAASQDAYNLWQVPQAANIANRVLWFTIFSVMSVLKRIGALVDDDEHSFEQELVQQFVREADAHGDPVHVSRSLGWEAELMGRMGRLQDALGAQARLEQVYVAEEMSDAIVREYGSARAAQSFSVSSHWLWAHGEHQRMNQQMARVLEELLPQMDLRNLHNTFVVLYPVLWILKSGGEAKRAAELFETMIVEQFEKRVDEGATTYFASVYWPTSTLLGLAGGRWAGEELEAKREEITQMLLQPACGVFKCPLIISTGSLGRDVVGIVAEICLHRAKELPGRDSR